MPNYTWPSRILVLAVALAAHGGGLAEAAVVMQRGGATSSACALLTASELEAALGAKVTLLPAGAGCMGRTPVGTVMLTLRDTKTGAEADAELTAAVAQAKQRGIQMDVKKFASMTCTTMSPMKGGRSPFLTSCSVLKGSRAAVVEVTAQSQKDMVPIEKVRPLAEKMATRF